MKCTVKMAANRRRFPFLTRNFPSNSSTLMPSKKAMKQEITSSNDPIANSTAEQSALIIKFRSCFNDEENDKMTDHHCIRFLIASEWNTEKAVTMKQHDFKIRRNLQCDLLLSKPKDPVIDSISELRREGINSGCFGQDKCGRPVCYQFLGAFLNLKLYKYISMDQYMDWMRYKFESTIKHQLRPSEGTQILIVFDMADVSLGARRNLHFVNAVITYNDAHYPEYAFKILLVNAPRVLSMSWSLLTPVIPQRVVNGLSIHDKESTPSVLAEYIDKKYLPKMYGGDVDDKKCFTPKLEKDDIKKSLSELKRMREENANRAYAKSMHLAARQTETIEVQCEANFLVKWWFMVESHDVMFSVRWKPHDQEEWIEIRESAKKGDEVIDGTRAPVYSDYLVDCAGTMQFEFSNKDSMWRGKTISYDIRLLMKLPNLLKTSKSLENSSEFLEKKVDAKKTIHAQEAMITSH